MEISVRNSSALVTDTERKNESLRLGMWLFLASETVLFGGMFCIYFVFRGWYFDAFKEASAALNAGGSICLLSLIISSFAMARALVNAKNNNTKWVAINVVIALICAGVVIISRYFEYSALIQNGMLWGSRFSAVGFEQDMVSVFFSIYFLTTGLHVLHVIIGTVMLTRLANGAMNFKFTSENYLSVQTTNMFWQLITLLWVFIYPFFYQM